MRGGDICFLADMWPGLCSEGSLQVDAQDCLFHQAMHSHPLQLEIVSIVWAQLIRHVTTVLTNLSLAMVANASIAQGSADCL